jgi:hypothetical protein
MRCVRGLWTFKGRSALDACGSLIPLPVPFGPRFCPSEFIVERSGSVERVAVLSARSFYFAFEFYADIPPLSLVVGIPLFQTLSRVTDSHVKSSLGQISPERLESSH